MVLRKFSLAEQPEVLLYVQQFLAPAVERSATCRSLRACTEPWTDPAEASLRPRFLNQSLTQRESGVRAISYCVMRVSQSNTNG